MHAYLVFMQFEYVIGINLTLKFDACESLEAIPDDLEGLNVSTTYIKNIMLIEH